ncbi:XRE family transcriptional regulator [Paenibacillus woosongensis]|uniref:XRE family transcriptional regulator n=1 Tax=Paenibacillus woosongensis TaxID=307580 RepID=A0AA95L1P4_9BACL|nr:XRE family transcriptional regulator [Paenibacillus woosongensis]WHX48986.1 XRE family transcriptional regulator [Paenibacillus woosongensis]
MASNPQMILDRINLYLDGEGFKKERLAKRLGKSTSAFYANLSGKNQKVAQFAVELAEVLGLPPSYFIEEDFKYVREEAAQIGLVASIAFSAGELSEEGRQGLEQIGKICDLVNIYS